MIIVNPRKQQASEATKKQVKEKIDISNLAVGISKLRKGVNGSVILGCESTGEMEKLKASVQVKLGEDFQIMEPKKIKSKIKIINVGMDVMNVEEEELVDSIKKQNALNDEREGCYIKLLKKITMDDGGDTVRIRKRRRNEGSLILEVDEMTHDLLLKRMKVNIGWNKCPVFEYYNVKRCFKCWGFRHIAKNCLRQDTCHKYAGNHLTSECTAITKKCINCLHKIKTYNIQINDDHDALSTDCPTFKRILEEEKRRTSWESAK